MMTGYEFGMMVREAAGLLGAGVCWLLKLAVVLAVMLAPAAVDALIDFYL